MRVMARPYSIGRSHPQHHTHAVHPIPTPMPPTTTTSALGVHRYAVPLYQSLLISFSVYAGGAVHHEWAGASWPLVATYFVGGVPLLATGLLLLSYAAHGEEEQVRTTPGPVGPWRTTRSYRCTTPLTATPASSHPNHPPPSPQPSHSPHPQPQPPPSPASSPAPATHHHPLPPSGAAS